MSHSLVTLSLLGLTTCEATVANVTSSGGLIHILTDVGSPQGLRSRDVAMYLPPSYSSDPTRVFSNVIVAHDGNNLFDANRCSDCCHYGCWGLDTILDSLIASGTITADIVVVAPYNTADRMKEYTYSQDPEYGGGGLDSYLDFLSDTLMPLVSKQFPRIVGAQQAPWTILGSSLGGLASCYAGWTRGATWSPAICMSSSFWWNSEDFLSSVLERRAPGLPAAHRLYIDWGSGETSDMIGSGERVVEQLQGLGWDQESLRTFVQAGGTHNEASWGARVDHPLKWLFPSGSPSGQCDLPDSEKQDCGVIGTTQQKCAEKGCCWHEASFSSIPWCYVPGTSPSPVCDVPATDRVDCGHLGTSQDDCEASGCCWLPSEYHSIPWCFFPTSFV